VFVTVELPIEALRRLEAEAKRRGVSVDVVITRLSGRLPACDALEAFIGCGASGDSTPLDMHVERAHR
jgi:hypothetical protein